MVVWAYYQPLTRHESFIVIVAGDWLEAFVDWYLEISQLDFVIHYEGIAEDTSSAGKSLRILAWAINTCQHRGVTVVANTTQVPLHPFEELKCRCCGLTELFLILFKAPNRVVKNIRKMLLNSQSLQEAWNGFVLELNQETDVVFAQRGVKLFVGVGTVDDGRGYFLTCNQIVALEAEPNYSD